MNETGTCPVCGSEQTSTDEPCPECSQWSAAFLSCAPTMEMANAPEAMVIAGRYLVMSHLGRGGFGVVYRAMDQRLERMVAVKRTEAPLEDGSPNRVRFEREARILARLDHPNIVPIFDAGLDDDHPFIVMKLVNGLSLAEHMAAADWDRRISEDEALGILRQVAAALAHAHGQSILHRDVKPSNILGDRDGRFVLADFGLSTASFAVNVTKSGVVVGTFDYMAPEIVSGHAVPQSDLYSLGVVLHEILFGKTCFEAESAQELFAKILHQEPPMLVEPPAEVSLPVLSFLKKLLHKDPDQRYRSAEDVITEIDRLTVTESGPTTAVSAELEPDMLSASLEHLEGEVEALRKLCGRSSITVNRFVEPFSRYLDDAGNLIGHLAKTIQAGQHVPVLYALVPSLLNLSREVERLTRAAPIAGDPETSVVEGSVLRLRNRILKPVTELQAKLTARREEDDYPEDDYFSFDEEPQEKAFFDESEWIQQLLSQDALTRHDSVLALLGDGLQTFVKTLPTLPEKDRLGILEALWTQADILLMEGRGSCRPIFESALQLPTDSELYKKWRLLYSLFKKVGDSYWDLEMVRHAIDDHPAEDRRVFRRSLLLHPFEEYRRDALNGLEPPDFWTVIAHERTPLRWILGIWRHLVPKVQPDYLKIFFICIHDRLAKLTGPAEVADLVEFVKELYRVDCFHESQFFKMLSALDERVRREATKAGLLIDFDSQYIEVLRKFTSRPACRDQPVAGWGLVPLPVQRILARRGHFQHHFACHPIDPIAMECLRHISICEDVSDFLKLYAINARLLTEVAKEERLFHHEHPKFLLVANPKTSTFIVTKHIGHLRTDSLRKLRDSRECNLFAREYAKRILEKRDKHRSGPETRRR